jgi:hypothetical protein
LRAHHHQQRAKSNLEAQELYKKRAVQTRAMHAQAVSQAYVQSDDGQE